MGSTGQSTLLVEENGLKKALLEITILEAQFHYYLEHDEGTAQTLLLALFEQIPAREKHRPRYFEEVEFEARLLEAIILSKNLEQTEALQYFELAEKALSHNNNILLKIQYQIALGRYFLSIELHERALSELLSAYWLASENDYAAQIARANRLLTTLFTEQGLYEQAIQHATQAAEYYERHKNEFGIIKNPKTYG